MMAATGKRGSNIRHRKQSEIKEEESKDAYIKPSAVTSDVNSNDRFMKKLLGFDIRDIKEKGIVKLLNEPRDPSSLGVSRVMFGALMMIDTLYERGFTVADYRWGDTEECRFPLFDFLQPLPVDWMYVAYLVMFLGGFGMLLGLFYRVSAAMFIVVYWYIFLLDKTAWNNHSYMFGLVALQMLVCDGHHYWSVDGLRRPEIRNSHVPLWNYALLRTQIFFVYFIAGLKKLDMDWVTGYSMDSLASNWVFKPFRYILTREQVSLYIVHIGGLTYDLSVGYLLFFDKTRYLGFALSFMFHGMNFFMFSIGMFPWTMMATLFIFCYADWPKELFCKLPDRIKSVLPSTNPPQSSTHCVYDTADKETETDKYTKKWKKHKEPKIRHYIMTAGVMIYIAVQIFLPYSHFLTKGFNNWTNGLYGYSWDMMVHTWNTQHIKVTYVDGETGEMGFLNPGVWTTSRRWAQHGDMLKQYSSCLSAHLQSYNISDPQLYFDVWMSINHRFQQRVWDPRIDIVKADWSPFKPVPYLLPLLVELSPWRSKLDEIEDSLDKDTDVVFVADFPGLYLENYISEDLGNTSVQVLNGKITIYLESNDTNITLSEGEQIQVPEGAYHKIYTVSETPSCYMYIYVNTTEIEFSRKVKEYQNRNITESEGDNFDEAFDYDPDLEAKIKQRIAVIEEAEKKHNMTALENVQYVMNRRYEQLQRGVFKTGAALRNIIFGAPPPAASVQYED
ncbi:vitamin K-dependent gamma-carboxylase-like isoform X2 [Ptychodera flava]|uniref:vitamin K-dependent gamma-carboxylase-like isoform X2 n=1 Tax=Ptychodera flava TaxID=63121 RepID=UPI00396A4593